MCRFSWTPTKKKANTKKEEQLPNQVKLSKFEHHLIIVSLEEFIVTVLHVHILVRSWASWTVLNEIESDENDWPSKVAPCTHSLINIFVIQKMWKWIFVVIHQNPWGWSLHSKSRIPPMYTMCVYVNVLIIWLAIYRTEWINLDLIWWTCAYYIFAWTLNPILTQLSQSFQEYNFRNSVGYQR